MTTAENPDCVESLFLVKNGEDSAEQLMGRLEASTFKKLFARKIFDSSLKAEERRACYVQSDSHGQITHLVLFTIEFDEEGYVSENWRQLPLEELAERAGNGPDLGNGPIKLSCRSQCAISWHSNSMWDPIDGNKSDLYSRLAKATEKAHLKASRSFFEKIPEILNTPIPIEKIPELLNTPIPIEKVPELLNKPIELEQVQKLLRKNVTAIRDKYMAREQKLVAKYQSQIKALKAENQRLQLENRVITEKMSQQDKRTDTTPGPQYRNL